MSKFQRLKSIDGSGTITRFYELEEGATAEENVFYQIIEGKAGQISSTEADGIIGFSHGGKLSTGEHHDNCVLLDINPSVIYMQRLEVGDTKPAIGDVVDGFKEVIETHYKGVNTCDRSDNLVECGEDIEYFLFTIKKN